jgi:hypothetical protein
MNQSFGRICSVLAAFCVCVHLATGTLLAQSSTIKLLSVGVVEVLDSDGSISYRLRPFESPPFDRIESLTGPNGEFFDLSTNPPVQGLPPFANFADLSHSLFGDWTFRTAPTSDPLAIEQYVFEITPFELSDVTVSRPTVLPANGSSVTSPFDFIWNPPSRAYGFSSIQMLANSQLITDGQLRVTFNLPKDKGARMTFSTNQAESLAQFISGATPPPVNPTFDLRPSLTYRRSIEVEVTPFAVPEPGTACMLILVSALVFSYSRRLPYARRSS